MPINGQYAYSALSRYITIHPQDTGILLPELGPFYPAFIAGIHAQVQHHRTRSLARLSCTGYRATCPISGFQPSWRGVSVRMLAFRAVDARGHVRDPCRLKSCPSCPPVGVRASSSDTRTRRWPVLLVFSVFYHLLSALPCGTINISNSRNSPGKPLENGHFPIAKMMRFRAPIIEWDETGGGKNPIPKGFQRFFHWLLNFATNLSQNPRILDTLKIRPLLISFSYLL